VYATTCRPVDRPWKPSTPPHEAETADHMGLVEAIAALVRVRWTPVARRSLLNPFAGDGFVHN
jgi:hypothetical protein